MCDEREEQADDRTKVSQSETSSGIKEPMVAPEPPERQGSMAKLGKKIIKYFWGLYPMLISDVFYDAATALWELCKWA